MDTNLMTDDVVADETVDPRVLRDALGLFATGVTIITCRDADGPHGFTANAFTSVSLDPPLVLVSVDREARANAALADNRFAVHVLGGEDASRAWHFAGRRRDDLDIGWDDAQGDPPTLRGCLATVQCEPWAAYDGGDHVLYVGRVQRIQAKKGEPLIFFGGKFHQLPAAPSEAVAT